MHANIEHHPLAIGSDGVCDYELLEGKVTRQAGPASHESVYNVKVRTTLGFTITFGYSRYKDTGDGTHAWVAFGRGCDEPWKRRVAVDFLLNIAGYKCLFGSDGGGSPAVGGSSSALAGPPAATEPATPAAPGPGSRSSPPCTRTGPNSSIRAGIPHPDTSRPTNRPRGWEPRSRSPPPRARTGPTDEPEPQEEDEPFDPRPLCAFDEYFEGSPDSSS